MEIPNTKFSKILKTMKSSDFIVLCVIFTFFIIVFILFLNSTNFIIKNINKIFSPTDEGGAQALNIEDYSLVAKKLNLPINTPSEDIDTPVVVPPPNEPVVDNTVIPPPPETPPELDKKSITINILNSTTKKGMAALLAKALEDAGFSKATTGDEKQSYALTTIKVKDSKKDYTSLIEEAVKKSYPKALTEINPLESSFDVVIIIGKE